MDDLERALSQRIDVLESGKNNYDLVVNDQGMAEYRAPTMAQGQQTLESQAMNPFASGGMPQETESAGEFTETIAGGTAGAVGGAAAVTTGLPGDLVGLGKGIVDAIGAEEGERFSAFLDSFADISNQIGSGKTIEIMEEQVNNLPVSDEMKADIMAGSKYLGEWAELPVTLKGLSAGIRSFSKGQSATTAKRNVNRILGKAKKTDSNAKQQMVDTAND
jgi:hypothetical protein